MTFCARSLPGSRAFSYLASGPSDSTAHPTCNVDRTACTARQSLIQQRVTWRIIGHQVAVPPAPQRAVGPTQETDHGQESEEGEESHQFADSEGDRQDRAEEGARPVTTLVSAAFGALGLFLLAVFMGWL